MIDKSCSCVLIYASKKEEVHFSPIEFRFDEVKNFKVFSRHSF